MKGFAVRTLFVITAVGGCAGPTEPTEFIHPALRELEIQAAPISRGGALMINAVPTDPGFSPGPQDRIPLIVRTSAGEMEELLLKQNVCNDSEGNKYRCNSFTLDMERGHSVDEIVPYLDRISGRLSSLTLVSASDDVHKVGSTGSVEIFQGKLDSAMAEARTWPHVRIVIRESLENPFGADVTPPAPPALRGGAPLNLAEPVRNDGVVQARAGDTVTVEYRQPDGSMLSTKLTL